MCAGGGRGDGVFQAGFKKEEVMGRMENLSACLGRKEVVCVDGWFFHDKFRICIEMM